MGAEIQDVLIRLRSDASGVEEGNRRAGRSFTELNQAVELSKTAFAAVAAASRAFFDLVERGQAVSEITSAFESLNRQAGAVAESGLFKLREATDGLISNMDLMRASNEALLAGLTPEQFQKVAAAADQLGDAVGVNTKQALDDITASMATGVTRGLERTYGLVIDNRKAMDDFARQSGKTADMLNELGQREAARIAILEALEKQQNSTGASVDTVGDELQKLSAIAANVADVFAKWLNEQPAIVGFFQALTSGVNEFATGLEVAFNATTRAQLFNLRNQISSAEALATPHEGIEGYLEGVFGGGPTPENIKRVEELKQKYKELEATLVNTTQVNKKLNESFFDQGKVSVAAATAAKKSADSAFDEFKNLGLQITNQFNDVFNNFPIIGEHRGELSPIDKSFERSVDFFADLLTPMFEGQAANFEDIFMDAGKRVAIGFGAQLAASLAKSAGFGELGDLTDATGLGKILAEKLGLGASGAGSGALGSLGSLGPFGGALAVLLGAGGGGALLAAGLKDRNPLTAGGGGALLGGSLFGGIGASIFGLGGAGAALGGLFGGDSQKGAEREARENLINEIFGGNLSFGGGTIDPSKFNASGKFGGQGTALVNPFAQILSGGDDKLGSDLAGIFENAVTESDNFNETIVKTLSLMDRLGTNAEDAKNQLSELFLDGKISIDEFSTGIDNLNILAQEDLTGPNSVADAINIVTENLDNPRVALKGLELAFKEMAELGIDSSEEIHGYLTEKFGPQIASAFDHIMAAGLDTWEEIGNAAPDQLKVIFNELKPLQAQFDATAESARTLGDSDMSSLNDGLKRTISLAKEAKKEIDGLNRAVNSASTQTLNTRPA